MRALLRFQRKWASAPVRTSPRLNYGLSSYLPNRTCSRSRAPPCSDYSFSSLLSATCWLIGSFRNLSGRTQRRRPLHLCSKLKRVTYISPGQLCPRVALSVLCRHLSLYFWLKIQRRSLLFGLRWTGPWCSGGAGSTCQLKRRRSWLFWRGSRSSSTRVSNFFSFLPCWVAKSMWWCQFPIY